MQILVVLAAVLGTIIYRISVVSAVYGGSGGFVRTHAKLFTTMTAATINLIIIMILTRVNIVKLYNIILSSHFIKYMKKLNNFFISY